MFSKILKAIHKFLNKSYQKNMDLTEDHILILEIIDEYNKKGILCDDYILKNEFFKRNELLENK